MTRTQTYMQSDMQSMTIGNTVITYREFFPISGPTLEQLLSDVVERSIRQRLSEQRNFDMTLSA